jgi:hypothetical protein
MRRAYFERVGYHLEVSGMQRAAALVLGHEDLRMDNRLALIGWLFAEGQGLPVELHRHNVRRYRKRADELGITSADLLDMATTNVRLDFDMARMVAA